MTEQGGITQNLTGDDTLDGIQNEVNNLGQPRSVIKKSSAPTSTDPQGMQKGTIAVTVDDATNTCFVYYRDKDSGKVFRQQFTHVP